MNEAAAGLLGEHDFATFCKRREGATTIRTLQQLSWQRDGAMLSGTVVADAFCHSMVRALVGCAGRSRRGSPGRRRGRPRRWPRATREASSAVVPAHGLTLEEVGYPDDRTRLARARASRPRAAADPVGRSTHERPLLQRRSVLDTQRRQRVSLDVWGHQLELDSASGVFAAGTARQGYRGSAARGAARRRHWRSPGPRMRLRRDRLRAGSAGAPGSSLGRRRQRASPAPLPRQRINGSASPTGSPLVCRRTCRQMWSSPRSGPIRRSGSASRPCTSCCAPGCRGSPPTAGRCWWSARISALIRSRGGSSSRASAATRLASAKGFRVLEVTRSIGRLTDAARSVLSIRPLNWSVASTIVPSALSFPPIDSGDGRGGWL